MDQYFDLSGLSKHLSLSPRQLRYLIRDASHPLPAIRIGGKYLFKAAEVQDWIESHRVEPTTFEGLKGMQGS